MSVNARYRCLLTKKDTQSYFNNKSLDIGQTTHEENVQNEIGDHRASTTSGLPIKSDSYDQKILQKVKDVHGCESLTKSKLQFVSDWILTRTESREKSNYMDPVPVVSMKDVPRFANIIS